MILWKRKGFTPVRNRVIPAICLVKKDFHLSIAMRCAISFNIFRILVILLLISRRSKC